jgi:hypothetical protein
MRGRDTRYTLYLSKTRHNVQGQIDKNELEINRNPNSESTIEPCVLQKKFDNERYLEESKNPADAS